jgi:putative peptide zinc metalloprotease protein
MLAKGIDLIGEYEGSGFKETPYLARRMDGQVLQLTQLLYFVAEEVDGERNFEEIAEKVTEKFGRAVSADNVKFLVEDKLRPIGVLAAADGTSPKLEKADPMLALNFRTGLVPERAVRTITSIFYPLFYLPVMLAVVGGLVALDVWLFFIHGVAQSVRDIAYQPVLFLMVFGLVVVSAAFHECGHATACRFGGAKPGQMGAGIYLVYPAFFSDVTDVYRLGKVGRVRTDLGGIYFNMIFSLVTAGAYFWTGFEPLLAIIVIQHLEMLHQLLPFLRLDGYYIISDVTGVPDLFARMGPILRSFIPGRDPTPPSRP